MSSDSTIAIFVGDFKALVLELREAKVFDETFHFPDIEAAIECLETLKAGDLFVMGFFVRPSSVSNGGGTLAEKLGLLSPEKDWSMHSFEYVPEIRRIVPSARVWIATAQYDDLSDFQLWNDKLGVEMVPAPLSLEFVVSKL